MIRDVAVKVPEPDDFIAESVFPSHIIVPRCSGISVIRTLPRRRTPGNKKGIGFASTLTATFYPGKNCLDLDKTI